MSSIVKNVTSISTKELLFIVNDLSKATARYEADPHQKTSLTPKDYRWLKSEVLELQAELARRGEEQALRQVGKQKRSKLS